MARGVYREPIEGLSMTSRVICSIATQFLCWRRTDMLSKWPAREIWRRRL